MAPKLSSFANDSLERAEARDVDDFGREHIAQKNEIFDQEMEKAKTNSLWEEFSKVVEDGDSQALDAASLKRKERVEKYFQNNEEAMLKAHQANEIDIVEDEQGVKRCMWFEKQFARLDKVMSCLVLIN